MSDYKSQWDNPSANGVGGAHFEHITRHVLLILDLQGDLPSLVGDSSTRLDFVISVTTSIAVGSHDDDVLTSKRKSLIHHKVMRDLPGNKEC